MPLAPSQTSVQVVLRVRPPAVDSNVPTRFQRSILSTLNSTTIAIETCSQSIPPTSSSSSLTASQQSSSSFNKTLQRFTFDRVYSPDEGQSSIWSSVDSLVFRFLEGYNVTVLAYGQTSSGKSYTMGTDRISPSLLLDHPPDNDNLIDDNLNDNNNLNDNDHNEASNRIGIIPRAVKTIFQRIRQSNLNKQSATTIKTSYVEIYNEDLIDLIASSSTSSSQLPQVTIREDKDGNIIWSGLKEIPVKNPAQVMDILSKGSSVRQTGSTDMNAQSSRSHAIFSLSLSQRKVVLDSGRSRSRVTSPTPGASSTDALGTLDDRDLVTVTSKFHFVDLAGSERLKRTAAVGDRAKEGISINSGLHALGNVISALGDPSKVKTITHVPYRDSKLTRLLQDSLGGNAHTLMIACVSPSEYNLNETLNTIKYANRARNIKNRAEVNAVEAGWEDVDYLQSTVLKLRKQILQLKSPAGTPAPRTLNSINEEPSSTCTSAVDERVLELQGHLSELQSKFAKTMADLAQAQSSASLSNSQQRLQHPKMSQGEFENMIQPVVEEYEKSITALESQLALTKAALVHAESTMKEQEEKLLTESTTNENQTNLLRDLQSRYSRLIERESSSETYIKDLEHKLKSFSDSDQTSFGAITDLRKEVFKLKENETRSENYIKDLESKLLQDEEASSALKRKIDLLERQLETKQEKIDDFEIKFQTLRGDLAEDEIRLVDQGKLLIVELEEKDRKLKSLEAALQEFHEGTNSSPLQRSKLTKGESLLVPGPSVSTTIAETSSSTHQVVNKPNPISNPSIRPISPRNFTPPCTPGHISDLTSTSSTPFPVSAASSSSSSSSSSSATPNLTRQLDDLQERYEASLTELEQIQTKYNNSVKEIEDLISQLDEARLLQPTPLYRISRSPTDPTSLHRFPNNYNLFVKGSDSPVIRSSKSSTSLGRIALSSSQSPQLEAIETLEEPGPRRNGDQWPQNPGTPVKTLSLSGGVLGTSMRTVHSYSGPGGGSGAGRYSTSSRRGSSTGASAGNSHPHVRSLSLSLSQDLMKVQRAGFLSAASGSLLLSAVGSTSPRSVSPRYAAEQIEQQRERSYESLEKEVLKLQEVLKEREEEITGLERSLRLEIPSGGSPTRLGEPGSSHPGSASASPVKSSDVKHVSLTSSTTPGSGSEEASGFLEVEEKAIQRLDDLMRSMAQKESAHVELIESLREELSSRSKAHEELVKLSRDQVGNMSSEIEALRDQLCQQEELISQLNDMEKVLLAKEEELEKVKKELKAKEEELQLRLMELVQTQKHELEQVRRDAERRLEDEKSARLELEERVKNDYLKDLMRLKEVQQEEMKKVKEDMEEERVKLIEVHEHQIEQMRAEHEEILVASLTELDARRTRKFESSIAALEAEHKLLLESVTKTQQSGGDWSRRIEEVKVEYERKFEEMKANHKTELEKIRASARGGGGGEAEAELQEALDALSTLDKALLESQVERERLLKDLKLNLGARENAEVEIGLLKAEREQMIEEREKLLTSMANNSKATRAGIRSDSPSSLIQRNPRLLMGGGSGQNKPPPPPTPPPTMPPPPLPLSASSTTTTTPTTAAAGTTSTLMNNSGSILSPPPTSNGPPLPPPPPAAIVVVEGTSNNSSQLSRTDSGGGGGRESPSTSVGTNNSMMMMMDSASLDPRILKKIEEQDHAIVKLSKQLTHCEADLKSNIDLVTNLESALNDTERNLRKSRLQMNELVKERDKLLNLNEGLRYSLDQMNLEVEGVKNNVKAEKVEFDKRLDEERRAKENAKKLLESRMEEMQNSRMTRKSKFNCF